MIQNVVQQMQALAAQAAAKPSGTSQAQAAAQAGGSFATELQRSLVRVSQAQESSNAMAQAYELGVPGVSLDQMMIEAQKAGIAFQATVQVRNRLVAAYQEISNMPV